MKKLILVVTLIVTGILASNAQEVGIRGGDVTGGNIAIDGIFSVSDFSRIHADVSFGNGVGIDALWDFLYKPLGGEAFDWYAGAGVSMFIGDPFKLGIVGEIGLSYTFNSVPISISGDYRPAFIILENTSFDWGGFGINVRYVFGSK